MPLIDTVGMIGGYLLYAGQCGVLGFNTSEPRANRAAHGINQRLQLLPNGGIRLPQPPPRQGEHHADSGTRDDLGPSVISEYYPAAEGEPRDGGDGRALGPDVAADEGEQWPHVDGVESQRRRVGAGHPVGPFRADWCRLGLGRWGRRARLADRMLDPPS